MARDPMIAIKAAITRFDKAAQAYGVMLEGVQPDNHREIFTEYEQSRNALERMIARLV